MFPNDETAEPSSTVYQGTSKPNDQYSRAIVLNYDTSTGKYALRPILFKNIGGAYVGISSNGKVELQTSAGTNTLWIISYDASKGGYILTDANGNALTAGSGYNNTVTTAEYDGLDTQIWQVEIIYPATHMIKTANTVEKKNIGRGQEWIFQLHTSEMYTRSITSWQVFSEGDILTVKQIGNYLVVKINDMSYYDVNDRFALLEITVDGYEKRTVVIQDSGTGANDGCRTFPLAYVSESKVIEIEDGEEQAQIITFNSGVGNVNITEWEIIDEFGCIEFYSHNGMNVIGSNYAIINAYNNGFAVIKARDTDGFVYTTAIEVCKYSNGAWLTNDYIIDIETENLTQAEVEVEEGINYLIRTSQNFNIWQTNFDQELGYYPGTLVSWGYDYAVVSLDHEHNFVLTASTNIGRELPITVKRIKHAIIILPGVMGSTLYADEVIDLEYQLPISKGTVLWDPLNFPTITDFEKYILALEMNSSGDSIYKIKPSSPIINDTNYDKKYGAMNMYEILYKELYDSYCEEYGYDIVLYEYDWRKDPYYVAEELDAFITDQSYSNVFLIGHSMGGIVASQYIALGETQRARVQKLITIGTPFLGSVKLLQVYSTGAVIGNITPQSFEEAVMQVAYNMPSVYSLLPSERYFQPYLRYAYLYDLFNTIDVTNYDDTMSSLEQYMPNWNKAIADAAIANTERLFLDNGDHITTLVDAYHIVGDGEDTSQTVRYFLGNGNMKFILKEEENLPNDLIAYTQTSENGDGTVLMNSATIGYSLENNRIFIKNNDGASFESDHTKMLKNDVSTSEFISLLINESYLYYNDTALYNAYRITRGYSET